MIRYSVLCQDSAGNSIEIDATADTDEQACAAVLRGLNSWKAVRALPKPRVIENVNLLSVGPVAAPPVKVKVEIVNDAACIEVETVDKPLAPGVHVIEQTGPESWARDSLRGVKQPTAMSSAFYRALSE